MANFDAYFRLSAVVKQMIIASYVTVICHPIVHEQLPKSLQTNKKHNYQQIGSNQLID